MINLIEKYFKSLNYNSSLTKIKEFCLKSKDKLISKNN